MGEGYPRTIAGAVERETVVKKSRFVCTLGRAGTEEEARALVEGVRRRHWEAGHHCTAWRLGPGGRLERSSDDGEPSGTAGAPMLEVLRGREVSDVVAVVTRYFGGVLLGAGGLVRAYSDAVRAGLDEARVLERRLLELYDVVVDHADAGRLENALRGRDVVVLGVEYGDLAGALRRLSPEFRSVVQAVVLDGLTTKEAGRLLGVRENTVKTRLHRAKAQLRGSLAGTALEQKWR